MSSPHGPGPTTLILYRLVTCYASAPHLTQALPDSASLYLGLSTCLEDHGAEGDVTGEGFNILGQLKQ